MIKTPPLHTLTHTVSLSLTQIHNRITGLPIHLLEERRAILLREDRKKGSSEPLSPNKKGVVALRASVRLSPPHTCPGEGTIALLMGGGGAQDNKNTKTNGKAMSIN